MTTYYGFNVVLSQNEDGLYADYFGPFSYDPSNPILAALSPSDPDYVVHIDDDTPDTSGPSSVAQKQFRIRLRDMRYKIKAANTADWYDLMDKYGALSPDQALRYHVGLWLYRQLVF